MNNKLLYCFLAFLIFSVCGCSRDKEDNGPNNDNWIKPQEIKDYALFKPGSDWIYQEGASEKSNNLSKPCSKYSLH